MCPQGNVVRGVATILLSMLVVTGLFRAAAADPIKRIQGTVSEVGEGFLLVTPDDQSKSHKFILRWKARFVPPKLPLKGDHVLVLYKEKPEGSVIYGLTYLDISPPPEMPDTEEGLEQESDR